MNYKKIITISITVFSLSFPMFSIAQTEVSSTSAEQAQSEGNVLGTLIVLNQNEIAAANLALQKTSNKKVKKFADLMLKQHTNNLEQTEALSKKLGIQTTENKVATELKTKGSNELASLNKLDGSAFDKAYINAMVTGHKEALNLVTVLIGESANPLVKKHLELTKTHVEHHLDKAEAIAKSL